MSRLRLYLLGNQVEKLASMMLFVFFQLVYRKALYLAPPPSRGGGGYLFLGLINGSFIGERGLLERRGAYFKSFNKPFSSKIVYVQISNNYSRT